MSVGCYQDPLGLDQRYLRGRRLYCLWSFLLVCPEAKITCKWRFKNCPSPQPLLEHLRIAHSALPSKACISYVRLQEETPQSQRTSACQRTCPRQRRRKLMCLKHLLHSEEESDQKPRRQGEGLWIRETVIGVKRVRHSLESLGMREVLSQKIDYLSLPA